MPYSYSLLSYTTQDNLPRADTACPCLPLGLGPPTEIINQENASQTSLQANWMEAIPEVHLFQTGLACVKLTKQSAQHLLLYEGTALLYGKQTICAFY